MGENDIITVLIFEIFQIENLNKIKDLEFKTSLNYTGNPWLSNSKTKQEQQQKTTKQVKWRL